MQDTLASIKNNEFNYLSFIVQMPKYLDITIIKEEFLEEKNRIMFRILKEEYKTSKVFIIDNFEKYTDFDFSYYMDLYTLPFEYDNYDNVFKELERSVIESYKMRTAKSIINNEKQFKNIAEKIDNLKEIKEFENDYIVARDMYNELALEQTRIDFDYPKLDNALNLSRGDLLLVAGGTGTGKTAFALNLLSKLSKDYQCMYFNMEMSKNILYRRLLAIKTQITLMDLNNLKALTNEQKQKVKDTMVEIEQDKIYLINECVNTSKIVEHIANVKTKKHLVVFIDHIGLIKSKGQSLYEKMTNVAKELRTISLNYKCTIIGLCQLSRESQRNETAPKLQDLRDSGELEQSSRKVILLYNENPKSTERQQDMQIIIAKNDDGQQNVMKEFYFDRYTQTFNEKN